MAKTDLGDKQVCPNCGAKFYDLRRRPATCPKCSTSFDPVEEGVRLKRTRSKVSTAGQTYEDDEEETEAAETKEAADDDEEEVEETPAIDAETVEPVVATDDEEEAEPSGDELPPGFSEEEAELETDAGDDDVPLLEDEEEFPEDEIGDIAEGDDEER